MSIPASSNLGSKVVCWMDPGFVFPHPADLLVDAGIFIAKYDPDDAHYSVVNTLWKTHIEKPPGSLVPALWVNDLILSEFMNRAYRNACKRGKNPWATRTKIAALVRKALADEVILHTSDLKGTSHVSKALELFEAGAGTEDAFHAADALEFEMDILTVDGRLAKRLHGDTGFVKRTVYVPVIPDGI